MQTMTTTIRWLERVVCSFERFKEDPPEGNGMQPCIVFERVARWLSVYRVPSALWSGA
jgi:hypothetical protein